MSFSLDSSRRYEFKLVHNLIDTSKTWYWAIRDSSLDDYDDNGRIIYQIVNMGVDSTGFFYKWNTYTYDVNGVKYTEDTGTTYLLNTLSGDFIITFTPDFYNVLPPDIDDVYLTLFKKLGVPEIINNQEHITASLTYSTINLLLTVQTESGYVFQNTNYYMYFEIMNEHPFFDLSNFNVTIQSQTSTQIVYKIPLEEIGIQNLYTACMMVLHIDEFEIHETPLDIDTSLIGCTGSNTASTIAYGSSYVNILTATTGYTLDGAEIHVYMGGVELDINTVYDSTTHTITIASVVEDLNITVSALKIHTFRFYSSDGLTLFATYNGVSITSLLLTISGTQRTLVINGSNTFTWTVAIPSGYSLIGLSTITNSSSFDIPLGIDFINVINEDTNYYETITQDVIVPTTFTMNLYKNSAEDIRVDKTNYLTYVGEINGTLRQSVNITKPVVDIEYSNVPNFNYVFIPQFNRYYYVSDITSISKNIWGISLTVDVLMSFKNTIRAQNGFIVRNQYVFDVDIDDKRRSYKQQPEIKYVEIPNSIFDVTTTGTTISGGIDRGLRFVLTVVGKDD